jgi:hypothetical protein
MPNAECRRRSTDGCIAFIILQPFERMPLDINEFREYRGGNPEKIRESQRRRFAPVEIVDEIIAIDEQQRKCNKNPKKMQCFDVL